MPLNHTVLIDFVCELTSVIRLLTTICVERGHSRIQWVPIKCRSRVLDKREDICVQTTEPDLAKRLKLFIKNVTTYLIVGQARSEQELFAQGNTRLNKLGYIFLHEAQLLEESNRGCETSSLICISIERFLRQQSGVTLSCSRPRPERRALPEY